MAVVIGVDDTINVAAAQAAGFTPGTEGWETLVCIRKAFVFLRSCAVYGGVPNADLWRLVYDKSRPLPWGVADNPRWEPGHWPDKYLVMYFRVPVAFIQWEIEAWAHAVRGMATLRKGSAPLDLMSGAALKADRMYSKP